MSHYKFSGHETFHCKHFWPKKGFEFLSKQNSFKSKEAVVELGVGKNMVASIAHWMKVLGLTTGEGEIELTEFANKFFQDDGYDPYIEDKGTLYILHYNLLSKDIASIYNLVFNQFRKTRVTSDFTSKQVYS